jgi:hypothetical protein
MPVSARPDDVGLGTGSADQVEAANRGVLMRGGMMSRQRQQMFLRFAFPGLTVCAVAMALSSVPAWAQEEFSSANRQRGRAAVEFRDADIHVVAAYYYSQRNHESRWLLIESGISTTDLTTIHRNAIALRTPQGREIPLATQRRIGENVPRIEQLLQNAGVLSHNVSSYFVQRDRTESMRLFTLPFGGVVSDDFVVDKHRVAVGPLFFEAPTGAWERGTYALIVRHSKGTAELPIHLE